jgi:GDP-L-fucose synthase
VPEQVFDLDGRRVWVAGHRGLAGSAIVRRLEREPIAELITATRDELDLTDQAATDTFVAETKPDVAILAAAKVGGIQANRTRQGEFLYDNLMIAANSVEACRKHGVAKTVVLGSSCIYPREAPQPIPEDALLSGPLEETNEGYAIAKIAALELGKMYRRQYGMDVISLMPTNLYGPGDNFDLETAHVLPALLRKIHEAKQQGAATVPVWGSGRPLREFLYVDDLADAVIFATCCHTGERHLNVGTGEDLSIRKLAELIADIVGWDGTLEFDLSMPDGTPRKLLNVSQLSETGWKAPTPLRSGLERTYEYYCGTAIQRIH